MFTWIGQILSWFKSLWTNFSDEDKEQIVNLIVSSSVSIFTAFYRASKAKNED